MKHTIALYRLTAFPDTQPLVLSAEYHPSAYAGCYTRVSEIVTVDFPEIVVDPVQVIEALAKEEDAANAEHATRLADIAARRAKVQG
jgi:hypothetical protein